MDKVGFGGSCHWCTEAIFLSLKGVITVQQGWIASEGDDAELSEAVIVAYTPEVIPLHTLIAVHLHTHSCTVNHSMRPKYRSAVYVYDAGQAQAAAAAISDLQKEFDKPVITRVLAFNAFRINKIGYLNYYYSNPQKPFCINIVNPKLKLLIQRFAKDIDENKMLLPRE